jgi:hypothetical protein
MGTTGHAQSVARLESNGVGAKVDQVVPASAVPTAYAAEQQLPDLLGPAVPRISVVETLQGFLTFFYTQAFWQERALLVATRSESFLGFGCGGLKVYLCFCSRSLDACRGRASALELTLLFPAALTQICSACMRKEVITLTDGFESRVRFCHGGAVL